MTNGWTGGQYSIARVLLAIVVLGNFITWPAAFWLTAGGAALTLPLLLGWRDRVASLLLALLLLVGLGSFLGIVLIAHALTPPRPYGSWDRRGDPNPGTDWRRPQPVFVIAWILLVMMYGLSFELLFRSDLIASIAILHVLAFNPAWIRPRRATRTETMFYDGSCALCHGTVRFVLSEDRNGDAFRFAPLASEAYASAVSPEQSALLPDSIVVQTSTGELLTRTAAVIHILKALGGLWRMVGVVLGLVPREWANGMYDFIAERRYRIFGTETEACPLLPPELRERFDR